MKKIVCGAFGNIYYATILKNGLMSTKNRIIVTDDAINAIFQHLTGDIIFIANGFKGYDISDNNGNDIRLCAYDMSKYELVKKENK